jgi:hypothetical protein
MTEPEALVPTPPAPSLVDAIGGPLGLVESSAPATVFVVAYAISGSDTTASALVALAVATLLTILRLARRETPRHALSGLAGVAFAAFVAAHSGRAENFFLPGLLANAAYATAFLVSIAIGKPLVAVLASQFDGDSTGWREDPLRRRAYVRATWLWASLFALRLLVQLPLYLSHAVVALGVAKTAMGLPLFALGLWLTWRLTRRPAAEPAPA